MTTTSHTTARVQPNHSTDRNGEQVMRWLEGHVPLSLIIDLIEPAGPNSVEILHTEGAPDTTWWVRA